MSRPVRVLVVEDAPDDVELILQELSRTGFRPDYRRVKTAEQMRAALLDEPWDVVVADGSSPDSLTTDSHPRNEEYYRALADCVPGVVYSTTAEGACDYCNQWWYDYTGMSREQSQGNGWADTLHPEDRDRVLTNWYERLRDGRPFQGEHRLRKADGSYRWFLDRAVPLRDKQGSVVRWFGTCIDIDDLKRVEDEFRQAQKLEAVGRLAGGIAHDFNNLITVIQGCCEVLLHTMSADDRGRELVEEIHRAGQRSAALTRQLLVFGRKQVVQPRVLDLNETVANAEKLFRRMIGEDVRLETVLRPLTGRVKADPGQLEQVLMNLVVNARDAMPTGGRLTIETADAELDEEHARLCPGVEPGHYVALSVGDTGCGMSEEIKARIFEPFFTTKEPGKGTGLGLAVVHGIVRQAGGHIDVDSKPGQGTTFKVYLPRLEEQARPGTPPLGVKCPPRGTETILLVEDEEEVRTLTRRVLLGCGYCVLEAPDGETALQVAARHDGPIHLLLTDVVMPGMGGRPLAERLRAMHPTAKVLFVSGYTDDAVVRHGILEDRVQFLQKPFSPVALALKLRDVMDSDGSELRAQARPHG